MKKRFSALLMTFIMVSSIGIQGYADTAMKNNVFDQLSLYDKIYKTQDEINEKYNGNQEATTNTSVGNNELEDDEISAAYKAVQDEEMYIVDLINRVDKNSTTTLSNWEYNLKWLKDNYDILKENEKANFQYIDSYIEAYEFVLLDKDTPDEKDMEINNIKAFDLNPDLHLSTYSNSYSARDAVEYAETYYSNYNPNYPNWNSYGGDCANFVSQCLYAGGKSKKYGRATDFSNWFSDGNTTDTSKVSSTWRGADAFKHYWKSNANKYKKFTSFSGAFDYGWKGDAVSLLNSNGRAFHTLIIVGYNRGDLVYGAHYSDKIDGSLKDASRYNDFIIYRMD